MSSKKIVWIGTYMTKECLDLAVDKGYKQVAATLSQHYFINGIEKNLNEKIDIISAIRPPSYPVYTDRVVKESDFSSESCVFRESVGFVNIKYLDHITRNYSLLKKSKEWANRNKKCDVDIFVYSLHSPFLNSAINIKKIITNSRIHVIVPDLPLNMDMSTSIKRVFKRIDWMLIKRKMRLIDSYVLFTKYMADYLNIPKEKWIVVEGLIDDKKILDKHIEKYDKKICLYMGTLKTEYGIDKFAEAFILAGIKDAELWIYGNGASKNRIIELSNESDQIKYNGYVSSDVAFDIMCKATLLVNPRPTSDSYTKYSCPSKTFEYMASGTPLLTTKLAGIPDDYFDYLYVFEDEDIEAMSKKIIDVFDVSVNNLRIKGNEAKKFMKTEKNSFIQCQKLIDFIRRTK